MSERNLYPPVVADRQRHPNIDYEAGVTDRHADVITVTVMVATALAFGTLGVLAVLQNVGS